MKMALLLAGQARSIDKLPYHSKSILRFIARYKPDMYCSFWDSVEARKAIDLFEPIRYNLSTEAEFQQDKQDWWFRWARLVSERDSVEQRRKWYWGESPEFRNRENTIRHWSRMTAGVHCIQEAYDLVVVTRTDIDLLHDPPIAAVENMNLYASSRADGSMTDCFFWGDSDTIYKLLNWNRMIIAVAHAELNGKNGKRPMSLVRGTRWLAPEHTLMVTMQYAGIAYTKQIFRTAIIR